MTKDEFYVRAMHIAWERLNRIRPKKNIQGNAHIYTYELCTDEEVAEMASKEASLLTAEWDEVQPGRLTLSHKCDGLSPDATYFMIDGVCTTCGIRVHPSSKGFSPAQNPIVGRAQLAEFWEQRMTGNRIFNAAYASTTFDSLCELLGIPEDS